MDGKYTKNHTKEAKDERGEVFTPEHLVEEMLLLAPKEYFTTASKTILDNSCGNGNFLVKVMELRIKNGISHQDAIRTIYGIELDMSNTKECRERLSLGSNDTEIWRILNNNIVCANALDPNHPGWGDVGYMWNGEKFQTKFFDFS